MVLETPDYDCNQQLDDMLTLQKLVEEVRFILIAILSKSLSLLGSCKDNNGRRVSQHWHACP